MKDYNDFYDDADDARAAAERKLPVCTVCGNTIYEDYYFLVDDETLCEDCMNDLYRKQTDDYVEDDE